MMGDTAGFLVVEFNQASHEPSVEHADVFRYRYEAEESAADRRQQTAKVGRRETYAVAELVLLEDPS